MSNPNETAIHREIEDDLRRLQMKSFWDENRLWIIGTIVLAILATAAVSYWRHHVTQQHMADTARLMAVLDDRVRLEALAQEPGDLEGGAHVALVRLAAAGGHVQRGETKEALDLYDALANDRKADPVLRDLGRLYAAALRLDSAPADALDRELTPLAREGAPWRFTALELQALLRARDGRMAEASEKLTEITGDPLAPQEARTRAFTLRELYQADAAASAKR